MNDKGPVAVSLLDSKTITYYGELLEMIKTYDSLKLDKQSPMNKVTVLSVRHRGTKDEILKMNGESLIVFAIDKGMVGKNSVANNDIGKITVTGDFAKGVLVVNDKPTPISYQFYKENGTWKFNLTSMFPMGNIAFKRIIEQSGLPENEALLSMLEMASGTKPASTIWLPLVSSN